MHKLKQNEANTGGPTPGAVLWVNTCAFAIITSHLACYFTLCISEATTQNNIPIQVVF